MSKRSRLRKERPRSRASTVVSGSPIKTVDGAASRDTPSGIQGPLDTLTLVGGGVIRGTILHATPDDGVAIIAAGNGTPRFLRWEDVVTLQLAGSEPTSGGAVASGNSGQAPPPPAAARRGQATGGGRVAAPIAAWTDTYPGDDYLDYDEREDATDTICVRHHGRIVAMFDRSNMKWETALMALVRDGHITLSAEQRKLVETKSWLRGDPEWFALSRAKRSELEEWTQAGKPVLRAARAKPGQGKTSARTADRIRYFASRLGLNDILIPEKSVEASRLGKALSDEYKRQKEDGRLAATERQIEFARELAGRCNIEVPSEALESFRACSEFISRALEIAPPSERDLQFARFLAGDTPVPDDALKNAKACNEWIDKMENARFDSPRRSPSGGD